MKPEMTTNLSFEKILKLGESVYLEHKNQLEKEHFGEYIAINVENSEYIINENKLTVLELAQEKWGQKLYYVTQIGYLETPTQNFRQLQHVAWNF
jgi:hypothetical protein